MAEATRTKLYIFVLVLNIVFPVFSYTFTAFDLADDITDYDISIDLDLLDKAGIILRVAESHNFTFGAGWVEWTEINDTIRGRWDAIPARGQVAGADAFELQKRSSLGRALNSWLLNYVVLIKGSESNLWWPYIDNATMVANFDLNYNWSRFVTEDGHQIIITTNLSHNNITRAVFDDSAVNVTIGQVIETEASFNFLSFLNFYMSLMIGDQSYGLPAIFSWVVRILAGLSIFAVVMLSKELISL